MGLVALEFFVMPFIIRFYHICLFCGAIKPDSFAALVDAGSRLFVLVCELRRALLSVLV